MRASHEHARLPSQPRHQEAREKGHTTSSKSPPGHPKKRYSLDVPAKLTRAKLNERSGDADSSKDESSPESPPELRRSWCVEGHLGDEGLSSRGTKLVLIFITAEEKTRRERSKPKGKTSEHQETNSDSEREEGLEDAYEDLNSPYKWPKPTPFTQRITRFKYYRREKLPRNIRVYEGNKDPEDHLGIFSAAAEQEEWSMPVWCKMFRQTLGGATRNWFDDLDPKSVDSFEELSQKFLEEFSQQKRYAKYPTEIHGIKRRQNEGLQAFMDRFKSKSSHIKGIHPVLRISAFMHGHGHPELAKKLNDKIPKTVDEMFERVRAFIRGEVAAGSAEMVRPSQGDKGYIRPAWTGGPKKDRNRGGPREVRRNKGVYTPYP
ncbi:reverse transcriptase domain-containing protein [Tanacetum coccineum]